MKKKLTLVLALVMLAAIAAVALFPVMGEKIPSVGILQYVQHPSLDAAREGFIKALADEGYVDGQTIRLDYQNVQYLYNDGDVYYFMDAETFEQPAVPSSLIGDYAGFLKEGMDVKLTFYQSEALDIELPTSVDLKVVRAEAAVRGDTATGVTKKVEVETGATVDVPMFVKEGDVIRVDTRTGSYVTRV